MHRAQPENVFLLNIILNAQDLMEDLQRHADNPQCSAALPHLEKALSALLAPPPAKKAEGDEIEETSVLWDSDCMAGGEV